MERRPVSAGQKLEQVIVFESIYEMFSQKQNLF